jgi:trigger factor
VAEVADTDLESMLERLRVQRKTWQPVERPAESGDRLTVAYVGTLDGDPFPGGSSEDSQIEIGSGRMIPGFEDGLVGASTGETRTIDVTFPEGYQAEHLAGKPARFEVTVKAVNAPVLPEIDAEFASAFGIADGDVERLRADVRTNMERELKERLKARAKERVMDLLVEANPIDVPSALVAEELRALKEQMREKLGAGQMELPDNLFEESARRRVVLGLIIAELVKRQGIAADPARVREAVEETASTYEDPQEVVDYYYADRRRLSAVESLVLEDQVVDWVLSQVTVEDEPMSFAEITEGTGA